MPRRAPSPPPPPPPPEPEPIVEPPKMVSPDKEIVKPTTQAKKVGKKKLNTSSVGMGGSGSGGLNIPT